MTNRSMFVGMEVHKESIDISLAEEGRDGEVRHFGGITGDLEALAKVVKALRAPTRRLRFVYEAGPCGFGIHRYLTAQGEDCVVVNPSSMPKRSGDRIKTERRDGDALARLQRAGELTAIYIPTPDDEALRDLVRAREDAVGLSTQAKHRLKAFLLRQGRRYPGRAGWTRPYRRWLADLSFPLAPQHIALQEYRDTIEETERRVERLTDQLRQLTPPWRWAPVVDALQGAPRVTLGLIDLFRARHDPASADRDAAEQAAQAQIQGGLARVAAINDDRLLRRYRSVIEAILRTNAFVPAAAFVHVKANGATAFTPSRFVPLLIYSTCATEPSASLALTVKLTFVGVSKSNCPFVGVSNAITGGTLSSSRITTVAAPGAPMR